MHSENADQLSHVDNENWKLLYGCMNDRWIVWGDKHIPTTVSYF